MNSLNKKDQQAGGGAKVLIPVDFSPKGFLAVSVGMELASRLSCEAVLIHASIVPVPVDVPQFPDDFNGIDNESMEMEEVEMDQEMHAIDTHSMDDLKNRILSLQRSGKLPDIKFDTVVAPGMPEEVIHEYSSIHPPRVVVMAPRGREKRQEDLIGSVTAEVIDHAFAPVLTVPEDYTFMGFKQIERICAFCHFDQGDFEAVSRLMDMFNKPEVKIWLFPATDKVKGPKCMQELSRLRERLSAAFPNSDFIVDDVEYGKNYRQEAEALFVKEKIQMILAPNRHRNALSRFFHPGLAHKILYEIDFPMLAIPVAKSKFG